MEISIRVKFEFRIPLTLADVACLKELSRHHYDAKCKDASAEPYRSDRNFLTGWENSLTFDKEFAEKVASGEIKWDDDEVRVPTVGATCDNLDTSLKIMEMSGYLTREKPEYAESVKKMRKHFMGVLTMASEKYNEWQAVYKG